MKISVDGKEVTIKRLSSYFLKLEGEIDSIVKESAKKIVKVAKQNVNVDRGNLKKSIKQKKVNKGGGPSRTVFPRSSGANKGYHRHFVAYGTAPRVTKTGKSTGKVSTKNDFMDKATKSVNGEYNAKLRKEVSKYVEI